MSSETVSVDTGIDFDINPVRNITVLERVYLCATVTTLNITWTPDIILPIVNVATVTTIGNELVLTSTAVIGRDSETLTDRGEIDSWRLDISRVIIINFVSQKTNVPAGPVVFTWPKVVMTDIDVVTVPRLNVSMDALVRDLIRGGELGEICDRTTVNVVNDTGRHTGMT